MPANCKNSCSNNFNVEYEFKLGFKGLYNLGYVLCKNCEIWIKSRENLEIIYCPCCKRRVRHGRKYIRKLKESLQASSN